MLPTSLVVAIALIYEFSLSEFNVLESLVIEKHFYLCYDYETITDLLQVYHSITMSVCTLTRRLQSYNLVKRKINVDEDLNRNIIRGEMQRPGQRAGYSKMWHILRLKHHVHARRRLVAQILHELDTDACKAWKKNKPHRRIHHSPGPNQCWHIDGEILIYKKQAFNLFLFNPFYNGKPCLFLHFYVLRRCHMIYAH